VLNPVLDAAEKKAVIDPKIVDDICIKNVFALGS